MPFRADFSPGVASLMQDLDISLILTTYQAGKVIILSSDGANVRQLLRDFDRPMGIAPFGGMSPSPVIINQTRLNKP